MSAYRGKKLNYTGRDVSVFTMPDMGLKDFKDIFGQLKFAQQQMKDMQGQLAAMRVEAQTGAGTVKAVVDGEMNLIDLTIDPSLLDQNEIGILPKLIKNAVVEAQKKAREEVKQKFQSLAGMMNFMPPG